MNIFIYSNEIMDERVVKSITTYDSDIFDWTFENVIGYSKKSIEKLADTCEADFRKNKFKNVIILPIKSMSDFKTTIEQDENDIFERFNDLYIEEQPFFLFIGEEEDDFFEYKSEIILKKLKNDEKEFDYSSFNEEIINNILNYKRKEIDFQLNVNFNIKLIDKIKDLKEYCIKLRDNKEDFEMYINNELFYQSIYNVENIDILKSNIMEERLENILKNNNVLQIKLMIYNININLYHKYYEIFEIKKVDFLSFEFKNYLLNNILRKYEDIDKRNIDVIRFKKTCKNNLLKYIGYFNQLGDIIFYDKLDFYPIKINIAICGYLDVGKVL